MSQSAALEFRLFARVGWSALAAVCCSKARRYRVFHRSSSRLHRAACPDCDDSAGRGAHMPVGDRAGTDEFGNHAASI